MIEQEISLAEAAEAIKEPVSTARRWCGELPLPGVRQGTRGAWRISTDGLEALKKVQQLRDAGRGMDSIRVVLGPVLAPGERLAPAERPVGAPNETTTPPSAEPAPAERPPSASSALDVENLVAQVGAGVAAQVVEVLERNNQLAAAYGQAQHKIGALEERVRQLEAERERSLSAPQAPAPELEVALAALSEAKDREASLRLCLVGQQAAAEKLELEAKMSGLERELAEARAAAAAIAPISRPWWKIWA